MKPARALYVQLHYFVHASVEGSIRGASRRLGVRPSTISRSLRHLEMHLGSELLFRGTKGVALTHKGHHLFSKAFAIVSMIEDILHVRSENKALKARNELGIALAMLASAQDIIQRTTAQSIMSERE